MDLRFLVDPLDAEGHPGEVFLFSAAYTTLAVGISVLIGSMYSSVLMVFFAVASLIPLFYRVTSLEAAKAEHIRNEQTLLREHGKALRFLIVLFCGMLLGYLGWYLAAPDPQTTFTAQIETLNVINSAPAATGNFFTANLTTLASDAHTIFLRNLRLLLLTVAFSTLFGVGALILFSWNASVLGVAIGIFIADLGGASIRTLTLAALRYLIHGLIEMAGYFAGALAGSIIFIEILKARNNSRYRKKLPSLVRDVVVLLLIAVGLLYLGAWVEIGVHILF